MVINTSKLKAVRIFPDLYNIDPFIERDHPVYHPDSIKYIEYWEDVERKCIEGIWGLDQGKDKSKGGWRYMPPNLYFYINVSKIIDEDDIGGTETISPLLRDIEWIYAYDWHICRGFSGFENDDEYTCHYIVKKIENKEELSPLEQVILEKKLKHVWNSKGELKKFIDPLKYLHMTHDKPKGLSVYENRAQNNFTLGSRGIGKSYWNANGVIGHEFIFFGKKRYDDRYLVHQDPVSILVGSAIESKSGELLEKFQKLMNYLTNNCGAFGSGADFIPGFFYRNISGSLAPNDFYTHKYRQKENGTWQTKGSGTEVQHRVFTVANPQAGVGGRFNVIVVEEVGLMGNVTTVHGALETTQIRKTKFGSTSYIGTGGNIEKIAGSKGIFLNPAEYDVLAHEDTYEGRSKPIGRFISALYANNLFKDKLGNTDLEAALQQELHIRREKLKASTLDPYTEYVQSRPIIWSEIFLSSSTKYLPSAAAQERALQIESTEEDLITGAIGRLDYTDKTKKYVKFVTDPHRKPIFTLNLSNVKDLGGAVIMYEPPTHPLPPRTYKNSLYKVVCDPVKDDHGGGSLYSIIVYKGYNMGNLADGVYDNIVMEWIGRYDSVDDMHEVAFKMATYYNAAILPEINFPDIVRFARRTNRYHMLQPAPTVAIGKVLKNPTFKYDVGVNLSGPLNVQSELLLKQWLLKERQADQPGKRVIDVLNSRRACLEISEYTRDPAKNFDHTSTLKVLAIWLNEEEEVTNVDDQKPVKEQVDDLKKFINKRMKHRSRKNNPMYAY